MLLLLSRLLLAVFCLVPFFHPPIHPIIVIITLILFSPLSLHSVSIHCNIIHSLSFVKRAHIRPYPLPFSYFNEKNCTIPEPACMYKKNIDIKRVIILLEILTLGAWICQQVSVQRLRSQLEFHILSLRIHMVDLLWV